LAKTITIVFTAVQSHEVSGTPTLYTFKHYCFDILPYFTTPYSYVFYSPSDLIFLLFILLHYQYARL